MAKLQHLLGLIVLSVALIGSPNVNAKDWAGRVVRVVDGDTLVLLTPEKQEIKVRLAEIDAPEHDQPYGNKAKQLLSDLAFNKQVAVKQMAIDRYQRVVGRVKAGQIDVNYEMVKQGGAWAYTAYLKDQSIAAAQEDAKSNNQGLWALQADQVMPPWQWRHGGKPQKSAVAANNRTQNLTRAVDGDTIEFEGKRITLWGIDAPELYQKCLDHEQQTSCGKQAKYVLDQYLNSGALTCKQVTATTRTIVSRCEVSGQDIGIYMVASGWALDNSNISNGSYKAPEQVARSKNIGLWQLTFDRPDDWRKGNRKKTSIQSTVKN